MRFLMSFGVMSAASFAAFRRSARGSSRASSFCTRNFCALICFSFAFASTIYAAKKNISLEIQ